MDAACPCAGVGGSGKQSLTKLAAFIGGFSVFQPQVSKTYGAAAFVDDLRVLVRQAGLQAKRTVLLLSDSELRSDAMLESVNSLLMSGEVPGLFSKDEMAVMYTELSQLAAKQV